jgi:hypothetical protein
MHPTTTDWASSDATQNITLAEADQFKNQLSAALALEFADRFVKTASGEIVHDVELRRSTLPAAPMNLWGTPAGVGALPVNIAHLRSALRAAAKSSNPVGELQNILHLALPKSDVCTMILRLPAVAAAIGTAIGQIG